MTERIDTVTDERLDKYVAISEEAFAKAKAALDDSTPERKVQALDFLNMAHCYIEDAKHFREKDDYVNAYGALNYAHGWLDAGARSKLFKVSDSRLFTVDEE
ncbi:DUF357 domain-containing protein [Candidatus Woesearchaeota archaeon]|nr:DUF357 domain-containing protein [Candidatus Woesearchaeota archaeon]